MPVIKSYAKDRAAVWLRAYLHEHGPTASRDVKAAANQAGHGTSTLHNVLSVVGVTVTYGSKGTSWSLSADDTGRTDETRPAHDTDDDEGLPEVEDLPEDPDMFEIEDAPATADVFDLAERTEAAAKTTAEDGPACPSCGLAHSITRRAGAPPGELRCTYCGHNFTPEGG
jgi:hypothetical protein